MPWLFIWKARARGDLLTGYGAKSLSYDTVGNLLNDGTWTYTWQQGRQLATMYSSGTTWTFTYDANGMRTSRYTNGGTEYTYVYNGSQLSMMTYGSNTLYFAYDAAGTPMTVNYNGTTYYYVTNLQGDVIAILNSAGSAVVQYTYDAWGNVLTTTGSMVPTLGLINPLRYRGYVYDRETGLYYLQSRYYNPTWGRFISADSYISTGQGILGCNMFAYCRNNPVNRVDAFGTADLCYDNNDDDGNPLNDYGPVRGGGGGASGGGHSNSGYRAMANSSSSDRPVSPRLIGKNILKNVDVHAFKYEYVGKGGSEWDIYKDTANNAVVWLGNKAQTIWIETEYVFEKLLECFQKGEE